MDEEPRLRNPLGRDWMLPRKNWNMLLIQEGHDIVIVNDDLTVAGEKLEKVAMGYEGWEKCGDELPAFEIKHLD